MKKFIALLGIGVLFTSTTVFAATSPSASAIYAEGFSSSADQQAAAERGMSAGEYYNKNVFYPPRVGKTRFF